VEELGAALHPIGHYFGWRPVGEEVERFARLLPPERMHAVFDGADVVAGAGVFPFELTVPGASLPCAGVTVVGVFPEHRRRGLNARMMRAQLADVRERGEPLAALWASEETIYGRYGYGQASHALTMRLPHGYGAFRSEAPDPVGRVRRIDDEEALVLLPRVYGRIRRTSPGFLSRSKA
jgi:predicted acetyltransferase